MEPDILEKYMQAGKIAAQVLDYGKGLVKPDVKLLDVANSMEKKVFELGGRPAFPVNISMNNTAAHDTAMPNDERVFGETIVKLDCGVEVDGYMGGDTAVTIDLSGKYSDLVKASREALEAAIKTVAVGVTLGEVGRVIEETIQSYGLKPVRNLSGHGIGYQTVHQAPSIPNYDTEDKTELEEGMTIAIEPFATDGMGLIQDKGQAYIHSITGRKPVRNLIVRNVLKECSAYKGMPFATHGLQINFQSLK